jgi:hypothetical protein
MTVGCSEMLADVVIAARLHENRLIVYQNCCA